MSSIHLWYPPFHPDCAQARRSSAQAIHSHPQVCAQSTAGNFLAGPVTWGCPGVDGEAPGRGVTAEMVPGRAGWWLRHNRRAAATGDPGKDTSRRALRQAHDRRD